MNASPCPLPVEAAQVLEFWFAAGEGAGGFAGGERLWFKFDPLTDAAIRDRFGVLVQRALMGDLDDWTAHPGAALALVLLLDQFTRNIYRGTARAFAGDEHAREIAGTLLQHDFGLPRNVFVLMPFEHGETLAEQDIALAGFRRLVRGAPPDCRHRLRAYLNDAERHREIIARFGRFPHRNAALGRESTREEQRYIESGAGRFGQ